MYFDDVVSGTVFRTNFSACVTSSRVKTYLNLTGDKFDIHRKAAVARSWGLQGVMVPGNLVTAIATGLVYEAGYFRESLVMQLAKSVVFVRPLFVGERVRVTDEVVRKQPAAKSDDFGTVWLRRRVMNEREQLVQANDQVYRIATAKGGIARSRCVNVERVSTSPGVERA